MALYVVVNVVMVIVLGVIARSFGEVSGDIEGWNFNYSIQDIVLIALIAAITGVINTGISNIWTLANSSLGPMGGALLQGSFTWAYILAAWLIRKPGVALAVGVIEASIEILLGNASGIGVLGWGIAQGLGIEVVLALVGHARWDMITAMAAGAGASLFRTVWNALLSGWDASVAGPVWTAIPINLISGVVLSGLIGYWLAEGIKRARVVRAAAARPVFKK